MGAAIISVGVLAALKGLELLGEMVEKLTDKDIQDTKAEQNNILSEMSKIKQELNEAMKM